MMLTTSKPTRTAKNRGNEIVGDRRSAGLSEFSDIAHPENSAHHRGDDEGDHEHLQDSEKNLPSNFQFGGKMGSRQGEDKRDNNGPENVDREISVAFLGGLFRYS